MRDKESKQSRKSNKKYKRKHYNSHKSPYLILKNYKVPRSLKEKVQEMPALPYKIVVSDILYTSKTVRAFLEASNRKRQTWIATPTKKSQVDDFFSKKEQNEENLYCECKQPYNPGELMFKCEGFCEGWYHPECLKMKPEEIERQKTSTEWWYCPNCIDQAQKILMETSEKLPKKLKPKIIF